MNIYIYQFVNYTLSFLMWMILGRVILVLMLGNRDTVIHRLFAKVTDPIYTVVRKAVPFAGESCIPAISVFIIIIIRLAIVIIFKPGSTPH